MKKARAMLDSLMGPNRDQKESDTEKFKDSSVCRSFLIGLCPFDPAYLGGKRNFKVCSKIHSEIMKGQLDAHPDAEKLRYEYELEALPQFEYAVNQCEARIVDERNRIREDWGNRVRPLSAEAVQDLSSMKLAHRVRLKEAEALDDDKFELKIRLMREAEELLKEATAFEERELKKAKEAAVPEEVCEVCGTAYVGSAGNAAHLQFRIHNAYSEIRDKLKELKERTAKARKERAEGGAEAEKDAPKEKDEKSKRDRSRKGRDASRDRGRRRDSRSKSRGDRRRGRDSRSRGKKGKDKDRKGSRSRSRSKGGRDRSRKRRRRD